MSQYPALLSIVYMMTFVLLFDRFHFLKRNVRFLKKCLMSEDDIDRVRTILAACQEN